MQNFNPRPPRGGRRVRFPLSLISYGISIHAPREGGDGDVSRHPHFDRDFNPRPPRGGRHVFFPKQDYQYLSISIHAPREGGDYYVYNPYEFYELFQSTPPARGATFAWVPDTPVDEISIHAPREGGDSQTIASK